MQGARDFAGATKVALGDLGGPGVTKERVVVRGDGTRGADIGGVHCEDGGWGHEPRNGGASRG